MRPKALMFLAMLPLAGCGWDDFSRPGTWRATGLNQANLGAMIADPNDLRDGRAARGTRGQAGAVAVERLETGRRFPLPASTLSRLAPVSPEPVAAQSGGGGGAR